MKKVSLLVVVCTAIWACTPQDRVYRDYYESAYQTNYPQKATNLKGEIGYLKAYLSWEAPVSPTCTEAVIYWASRTDSLRVRLSDHVDLNTETIHVTIPELKETDYVFEVCIIDREGSRSLSSQVLVTPVGPSYVSQLVGREVTDASVDSSNKLATVNWSASKRISPFSEFQYTQDDGQKIIIKILRSETSITINDLNWNAPGEYAYRSSFVVAGVVDTLWSDWVKGKWISE